MRLGMFMMPVHPLDRSLSVTLQEDREAFIFADKLGFSSAFVGEHLADAAETVTNSMMFLASVASETTQMKLGTGTTTLSHIHPVQVAAHAAMVDHMSKGRLVLGISVGTPFDAEALGLLDSPRDKIFAEAIDVILEIWKSKPPYNIDLPDNRFKVATPRTYWPEVGTGIIMQPYQKPRPEIVGTVVAPFSKGVIAMGERDFHPLSANFLLDKWLPSHWTNYCEGKAKAGQKADVSDWRVARTLFVADDDKTAAAYGRYDTKSPYRFYYNQMQAKMTKGGRQAIFKSHREQPDSEITHDWVMDNLVMHGSVNSVVDQILAMHERVGDFGELIYGSMDWVDAKLAKRSMELMATEVMPRVNAALAKSKPPAQAV